MKETVINEDTDKAAARGALLAFENCTCIMFAIINPSVPPTSFGVIQSPTVGIKIIRAAPITPGADSGSIILKN